VEDQDTQPVQVESLADTSESGGNLQDSSPASKRRGRPPKAKEQGSSETILFHVVEDGFSAQGVVWVRGQELEFVKDSPEYKDTLDREGNSWLDMVGDDAAQMQRFGKVMVRPGPWPGTDYEVPEASEAEAKRRRKPPRLSDSTK